MLGNSDRNRYCCFCKHWFDPSCEAVRPKMGKNLFEIDNTKMKKCLKINLQTKAVYVCKNFEKKFC